MEVYENSESVHRLGNFWEQSKVEIANIKADQMTFKSQDLPLARIKKIMKLDEDVKNMMISAEAPILFAKAAELFIREITLRAWIHTERNKRRTLQRSDITLAVTDGDTDQFDFLIDIVPREETKTHSSSTKREETVSSQSMHQVSGNMNLFGTNTIHLSNQGMPANQQTLIGGMVDTNNILQAQSNQNNVNVQNQPQLQYVLQIPSGTSLGGGQTIQIQMIPQTAMMSNNGGVNNVQGAVLNGQQQQQIFTLSGLSGGHTGGHGAATVVLQPSMLTGGGGVVAHNQQQQQLHHTQQQAVISSSSVAVSTCVATTDGSGGQVTTAGQYALATIKGDQLDNSASKQEAV